MPWFKVDDGLYSHPKWLLSSPHARALWVTAGSWCADHTTDGVVPRGALSMLGGRTRDAKELVERGLWHEHPDGFIFHEWLEFQPSADQVRANRAAATERQRRARDRASQSRTTNDRASRRDNEDHHGPPDPTRPDPKGLGSGGQPTRAVPDEPTELTGPLLEPAANAASAAAVRTAARAIG